MIDPYEIAVWDQLRATFYIAFERATIGTLEAVAAAAGVTSLDGMPIAEFHDRRKRIETEALIADFADVNPTAATHVKALLEKLDRESLASPSPSWSA